MDIKKAFGNSLRVVRKSRGLSQEDFSDTSSRTYLSSLERGLKSPTLDKIDSLSDRMRIHPLTLMTLTYLCATNEVDPTTLMERIKHETNIILADFNTAQV
jgi:transcriptional regulator with XRE-family HTH domain